jgi:hypothetical protein
MASGKPNKAGDALVGVARVFETTVRGSSVPASSLIAFSPQPFRFASSRFYVAEARCLARTEAHRAASS